MDKTIILATADHARAVAAGMPVQFEIAWALVGLLGLAVTVALVRCRHFGDNDLVNPGQGNSRPATTGR